MSRRRKIVYGVIASMLVVGLAVLYFLGRDTTLRSSDVTNQSPQVATEASQPANSTFLTSDNVLTLEKVNSPYRAEQELALISEMRGGQWSATAGLPQGATLKVIPESFRPDGEHRLVDASVTGSVQAKLILMLTLRDGQWLIYETNEVK